MTLLARTPTRISYATAGLREHIALPTIPAFGELTVYYDMYASFNTIPAEVGGGVRLGDPGNLAPGERGGLALREASQTPEPATFALIGIGLIAVSAFRRR